MAREEAGADNGQETVYISGKINNPSMAFWWVNHKQTFKEEIQGGFVWSPKTNSNGARNVSYDNLTRCSRGDVVFSYANCAEAARIWRHRFASGYPTVHSRKPSPSIDLKPISYPMSEFHPVVVLRMQIRNVVENRQAAPAG